MPMIHSDISAYGRKVKFYLNGAHAGEPEEGYLHCWFLCSGEAFIPSALIERTDGTMAFTSYRNVTFVNPFRDFSLEDLFEKGLME